MSASAPHLGHDQYEALAVAWAINALEPADQEAFEVHRDGCDICSSAALTALQVATELAYGVPDVEPPPVLRQRVLAAATPRPPDAEPKGSTGQREAGRDASQQDSGRERHEEIRGPSRDDGRGPGHGGPETSSRGGIWPTGEDGYGARTESAEENDRSQDRDRGLDRDESGIPHALWEDLDRDDPESWTFGQSDEDLGRSGRFDWNDLDRRRDRSGPGDPGPGQGGRFGTSDSDLGRSGPFGPSAPNLRPSGFGPHDPNLRPNRSDPNDPNLGQSGDGSRRGARGAHRSSSERRSRGRRGGAPRSWNQQRPVLAGPTSTGPNPRLQDAPGAGPGDRGPAARGRRRALSVLAAAVLVGLSAMTTWQVTRPTPAVAPVAVADRVAALSTQSGDRTLATIVVRDGQANVVTDGLAPNAGRDRSYVLWGVPAGNSGTPQVVGTFEVTAEGLHSYPVRLTRPLDGYPVLAVSEEAAGSTPAAPSRELARGALGT